jgi:LEA14-like dessication related protein
MRNHITIVLIPLFLAALLISTGCSRVKAPRFESMGVKQLEQTDSRTVYAFVVKATNPNKEPIPLKEVTYTVTLDRTHTFNGVRSPETTLHTYGEHIFELPAVFDISPNDLTGTLDYKLQGSVKYLKPGKLNEVLFDSKVSVPKADFTLRGKVNVDK